MSYAIAQSASDYLDLLDKIIEFVTAESCTAAAVNAGGSGYAVNDVLTVSGGTATIPVELVVTGVSSGAVTTVRISQSGAYTVTPSNPVSVTGGGGTGATFDLTFASNGWAVNRRTKEAVSATVAAGGTGYSVSDQLTVVGGVDADIAAVFNVDSVSGGAVTAVSLVTAGKYGETPANPAATTGGGGTGATLTVTYQDHVSTDFDVLLQGEGSGSDEIFVGIRSFTSGSAHNFELRGMTGYEAASPFTTQPGISPGNHESGIAAEQQGCYVPLDNSSITYWLFVSGRRIIGVFKVGASTYTNLYLGFINPFGTAAEFPYPLLIAGCSSLSSRLFSSNDTGYSGMLDPISDDSHDTAGPMEYRDPGGVWNQINNSQGAGSGRTAKTAFIVWPAGIPTAAGLSTSDAVASGVNTSVKLIPNTGGPGTATFFLKQTPETPDFVSVLHPTMLVRASPRDVHGELDGVYWATADIDSLPAVAASEDTFTDPDTGDRYHIFQNCNRTELFTYFAILEA